MKPSSKFSAVIFDMDGVLVDSEIHWKKVEDKFLQQIVPNWGPRDQQRILGMSVRDCHSLLTADYGLQLTFADYLGHYQGLAGQIYGEQSNLIDGADELIKELKESGVQVGLASSSPRDWIEIVIERFYLKPHLDTVVSADDLKGKSKPDPEIYQLAASKIGVDPSCCIAVEDAEKGLISASAAGMFCVGFRNGFNPQQVFDLAEVEVSSYRELRDIIKNLGAI